MNKEKDTFGCLFLILGRKKSYARGCNLMRRKGQWLISFSKYVKLKKQTTNGCVKINHHDMAKCAKVF